MDDFKLKLTGFVVIAFLLIGGIWNYQTSDEIHTFTVDSKERIIETDSEGRASSKYLIFSVDGRVFQNTDDIFQGKFNSSTFQARLKVGETYTVRTLGWRIEFMSAYPNIVEILETEKDW